MYSFRRNVCFQGYKPPKLCPSWPTTIFPVLSGSVTPYCLTSLKLSHLIHVSDASSLAVGPGDLVMAAFEEDEGALATEAARFSSAAPPEVRLPPLL